MNEGETLIVHQLFFPPGEKRDYTMLLVTGFTEEIDAYYDGLVGWRPQVPKPKQPLLPRIEQLLTTLEQQRPRHFVSEVVYVEPPVLVILAQNKQRAKPVPEKVILQFLEKAEPPTVTECHQLIVLGTGSRSPSYWAIPSSLSECHDARVSAGNHHVSVEAASRAAVNPEGACDRRKPRIDDAPDCGR